MALDEGMILNRIAASVYQKIVAMDNLANFKAWVDGLTVTGIKQFIKSSLQTAVDEGNAFVTELEDIINKI